MRLGPFVIFAALAVGLTGPAFAGARQAGPGLDVRSVQTQWAKSKGECKYKFKSNKKGWKEEYKCK